MKSVRNFFSQQEQDQIVEAIRHAEEKTSGEIRLHLENHCLGDPMKRAQKLFPKLGMTNTKERNGVLFYLAVRSRKFTILGDQGIHAAVGQNFWDETVGLISDHFSRQNFAQGLIAGILSAGDKLKTHFPRQKDDVNELPNEISFKENQK